MQSDRARSLVLPRKENYRHCPGARLQTPWHHQALRDFGHRDGSGDRQVLAMPSRHRVPQILESDRCVVPDNLTLIWCWTTMPPTRPRKFGRRFCGILATTYTFTPTHSSWLNQVERWFALLSQRQIKKSHYRVRGLESASLELIAVHNERPSPLCGQRVPMLFSTAVDVSFSHPGYTRHKHYVRNK